VITRLPKETLILDMLWRPDFNPESMDNLRADLTGNWFTSLKTVREKIDTDMKRGYIEKLRRIPDPFTDFVLNAVRAAALKRSRYVQTGTVLSYRMTPLASGSSSFALTIQTVIQLTKGDIYVRNKEIFVVIDMVEAVEPVEPVEQTDVDMEQPVIDLEYGVNIWSSHIRKFINEYELLRPDGDYQDQMRGLIPYQVTDKNVSRAYYKLYEMLKMREESLDGQHIFSGGDGDQILCMGEAPGGFINALLDLYADRCNTITGVSISEDANRARVWGRLEDLITKKYPEAYRQVHLMSHEDAMEGRTNLRLIGDPVFNTQHPGDILSLDNQRQIATYFTGERQASFITGDGGAPHDVDTESEIHHSRLIFAEILLALRCQKPGGNFILKLFDITTGLTLNLITILSHFYERVHLYKPKTSRLASSEKYIICMYFMPRDALDAVIPTMEKILENWNDETDGAQLVSLFLNTPRITTAIKEYNEIFMQKQTQFIRTGIEYAEKYNTMDDREIEGYMRQTLKTQLQGSCAPFLNR
jgi:23S rRNA U2552 (ribose-2'-O)-methylase RlmE/FtsJ